METNFFSYLRLLEILAFFSGYPLWYLAVAVWAGSRTGQPSFKYRMRALLPYSYALIGTLYLGLQLKYAYLHFSGAGGNYFLYQPYLSAWGLLAVLFWIPALAKKGSISLIHSLVFLIVFIWDIMGKLRSPGAGEVIHSEMNIYVLSILLNLGALIVTVLIYFLLGKGRSGLGPSPGAGQ